MFSAQKSKRTTVLAPMVRRKFGPSTKSSTAGWLCLVATNSKASWLEEVEEEEEEGGEVEEEEMLTVPDSKVLQQ